MEAENLKQRLIKELKTVASEVEDEEKEPVYAEFILDTKEGLFVVFPEINGEAVDIKKLKNGVYYFQIGNSIYFPSEDIWRLLLEKQFISFCVLPYIYDENDNIIRSFAGLEFIRIDFSIEDKKFFNQILEEIEKEKIKIEAKKELIEKLRNLGLTEEEIEKALMEN